MRAAAIGLTPISQVSPIFHAAVYRARARRDRYTAEKDRLDTEYMKGGPSLDNYSQRFTRLTDQYKADLINILGLAMYNGLYDAVENEVNSYAPFLLNLDQNYEEKIFEENFGQ